MAVNMGATFEFSFPWITVMTVYILKILLIIAFFLKSYLAFWICRAYNTRTINTEEGKCGITEV